MAEKKITKKLASSKTEKVAEKKTVTKIEKKDPKKVVKPIKSAKTAEAKVAVKQEKVVAPIEKKIKPENGSQVAGLRTQEKPKKAKRILKTAGKDTGSVDYQIKNFSDKINLLAKHLREHIHDFDSRRGLLIMVGKRRRLLNYVRKSDPQKYTELVKTLKLKK